MLTHGGCEVDRYLMTTPLYNMDKSPHKVTERTYAFKFPKETIIRHRCLISICDRQGVGSCQYAFVSNQLSDDDKKPQTADETPSECLHEHPNQRKIYMQSETANYKNPPLKQGFHATFGVEARRINVFPKDDLSGSEQSNSKLYCTSRDKR